tara:strand:+ start:6093 stop:6863 length:771 start_codon:yes stop_codon:yes gene_type:complete
MLKNKIKKGDLTLGSWITIGNTSIAEILSKAGFDWIVVDLEHSSISLDQAGELIRTIDLCGVSPLVRLTSNDKNQIKRVLDAGAHGIIVPMVNTSEDAENAVKASRYPPNGIRGVGLARAQGYGNEFEEYFKDQSDKNAGPIVIVQIEDIKGVKNLRNILSVPNVDAFIIGPYDLSCSMGIPGEFNNPDFIKVLNEIKSIGDDVNIPSGIHVVEPSNSQLKEAINEGYKFIAFSVDIRMLDQAARNGTKEYNNKKK